MEVGGQLHDPPALPQGKDPLMLLNRRWNGPQSRCGSIRPEKNPLPSQGLEQRFVSLPARSLVRIPTELSQLPMEENHKAIYRRRVYYILFFKLAFKIQIPATKFTKT